MNLLTHGLKLAALAVAMTEIGSLLVTLSVLTFLVHALGYLSEKLKQPRLIGEILAGVLVGPFVLGHFAPHWATQFFGTPTSAIQIVLDSFHWIGLILLMFLSGTATRGFMAQENGNRWSYRGVLRLYGSRTDRHFRRLGPNRILTSFGTS